MPLTAVEKSFCTTREAATQLGVSVGTVQLWVESGLLQAWKTAGGHRRVLRDSVEGLLHKKSSLPINPGYTSAASSGPVRLRVLVVEDDPNLLRLYETNIAHWPMAVDLTLMNNAIAAILSIGRDAPDLLIADLHMPGMDGFAMLKVLNQTPEMTNMKVLVVTGLDAEEVLSRGGVPEDYEVLAKPIPFGKILSIAQRITPRLRAASKPL